MRFILARWAVLFKCGTCFLCLDLEGIGTPAIAHARIGGDRTAVLAFHGHLGTLLGLGSILRPGQLANRNTAYPNHDSQPGGQVRYSMVQTSRNTKSR